MQTTWVVAADTYRARIFEISPDQKLKEVEDMVNPDGRMSDRDEISDAYGKFAQGKGGATGDAERKNPGGVGHRMPASTAYPQESMLEHHLELFSKEVDRYLDKAREEHRVDKLCVIAAPKFLGMIRRNMSPEVKRMVQEEIPNEVAGMKTHQVEEFLRKHHHH
jgi:protein required for attachment to host cells